MKVRKRFETDEAAENDGVWVSIGDGAEILLARLGNPKHKAFMDQAQKPYRAILRAGGEIPKDKALVITIRGVAETVLLGWRGFEEDDGSEMAYSVDKAVELMAEMRDFRDQVVSLAGTQEVFNKAAIEELVKNLPSGSNGRSASAKRPAS